jgi:hypothetical protein
MKSNLQTMNKDMKFLAAMFSCLSLNFANKMHKVSCAFWNSLFFEPLCVLVVIYNFCTRFRLSNRKNKLYHFIILTVGINASKPKYK